MNEAMTGVIEDVADGLTLKDACAKKGRPSPQTFRKWLQSNPELSKAWLMAKEFRSHVYFDRVVEIAKILSDGEGKAAGLGLNSNQIRALQVAIDGFKFAAARLNPRDYGERVPINPVIPIQITTSLNLGQEGPPRPAEANIWHLQATPIEVDATPVEPLSLPAQGTRRTGRGGRKYGGHKLADHR